MNAITDDAKSVSVLVATLPVSAGLLVSNCTLPSSK